MKIPNPEATSAEIGKISILKVCAQEQENVIAITFFFIKKKQSLNDDQFTEPLKKSPESAGNGGSLPPYFKDFLYNLNSDLGRCTGRTL